MRWAVVSSKAWGPLAVLVGAYLAFTLLACVRQRSMLYFPHKMSRAWLQKLAAESGLEVWPAGAIDYFGLVSATAPDDPKGTILVFHGNAASAQDRMYYVQALEPLGWRVVLYEYPGYAARGGKIGEKPFVEDARKAARAAQAAFGDPIFVWGESLGCGVAAAVAGDPATKIAGAVLLTPWDTLPNLAQDIYWYLPARWLVLDKFDNIKNLRDFQGPVAVIIAGSDEIIPNKRSERLYKSLSGTKQRWDFPGAGHNSWPSSPGLPWWSEVMEFVSGDRN